MDFKNNLKTLNKLDEFNEIKSKTRIELNTLNDEVNDILNLEFELELKKIFFNKANDYWSEEKLRFFAKEGNRIKILKKKVKNNEDKVLEVEGKISEVLADLQYENQNILNDIKESELKLERLGLSRQQILCDL